MQGRNMEAENEKQTMEAYCLLTLLPKACQPVSYIIQDHLPRGGATHSGLGPPSSVIK